MISQRIVENVSHISLINLLLLVTPTVRTMSSSEKRHELALVKRRHEELEWHYQVSLRLKEQENPLKIRQSQLELEHLAEIHKKQLIEMELKAFELEDNSSEISEKVPITPVPISSEPTTSVSLAHAINTSYSHNHKHTALSDP